MCFPEFGTSLLIILDRDGVINKKANLVTGQKYILKATDLEIYPDFLAFAAWAERNDHHLIVATNQQGLALALLSESDLDSIHNKIQHELELQGARKISRFYVCGHLDGTCECRKPSPGLLSAILNDFKFPLSKVVFVGDSLSDKLAADLLGIRFIQVRREPKEVIFGLETISDLRELIGVLD